MAKKVPHKISLSVVGVQYRVTMSTRRMIADKVEREGPIQVKLRREPDNEHDENALKVIVAEGPYKNMHIGYVRRQVTEILAPAIDSGQATVGVSYLTSVDAREGEAEILVTLKTPVKFRMDKLKSAD